MENSHYGKRNHKKYHDRDRSQLVKDPIMDVTLRNGRTRKVAFEKAPDEADSYHYQNGIMFHCKFLNIERNGQRYVDSIVVPASYLHEILRNGHTTPLSGHLGNTKTFDRIATHFFWPGLASDVQKYCASFS